MRLPLQKEPQKNARSLSVYVLCCLCVTLVLLSVSAQSQVIKGVVKDKYSDETIPFASLQLKNTGAGRLTDSAGAFSIYLNDRLNDTLEITYVGYQDYLIPIDSALLSQEQNGIIELNILLERGKYTEEVVVKRKIDRGLLMWKRIVRRKPFNDRYRFDNFSYELYNKLELDIKNVNKERMQELRLLKNFSFVFDNIDSVEGASVLPLYLMESLSNYYYQKSPLKRREVIKASKTLGLNNESISKMLGGMDQNINFYNNFIPVFDKQFISPISDNGDAYYKYKVADSQFVAGRRLIHLVFTPRRKGENTFEGDCWVHDSTFAIQKMSLRLSKEANINFVNQLSLIQEYKLINDTTWFLSKDKFIADVAPLGNRNLSFIGRKTATYKDIVVDDESVVNELSRNKILEEVILPPDASGKTDEYWSKARHEALSKNEAAVYQMVDTLLSLPAYRRARENIYFLTVGYKNIGNYEIGPWYNWITYNTLEGYRARFDLGTNKYFSKQWFLHAYGAYGFTDREWKYKMDAMYLFNKNPRSYISASYKKDIDYGQTYYDQMSQDNIFALAIRKSGVSMKFLMTDEKKIEGYKEWKNGFSALATVSHKSFDPLRQLPPKMLFTHGDEQLATAEVSIRLRYALLEKFLESAFNRISLGSPYPTAELKYTKGVSGVFNSRYNYSKLSIGVSHYKNISPFGSIYYNVFAGKTFGTLPYMLLDIAPGNEIYYYNKYSFNLMNRYEFLHDRYAGINMEHNIGNGIFGFIPLVKKLKLRQFYSVRALWGGLSEANRQYNMPPGAEYAFETLDGKNYLEVGTGIDNILKLFRIDFIWRVSPQPLPEERYKRFGVFGSFRLAF